MEKIVKDNKIYRFSNELQNTQDEKRKIEISSILHHLKNYHKLTNIERFHDMLLKCDKVIAKKPFHRLTLFQKKTILKDYLEKYLTANKMNKDKIDKCDVLQRLNIERSKYFIVSIHREENVDYPENLKIYIYNLQIMFYAFCIVCKLLTTYNRFNGKL